MRLEGGGKEAVPGSREPCGPGCETGALSQVSGDIGKILSKVMTKLDVFVLESSPWWLD